MQTLMSDFASDFNRKVPTIVGMLSIRKTHAIHYTFTHIYKLKAGFINPQHK